MPDLFTPIGDKVAEAVPVKQPGTTLPSEEEDDGRVVEEIESLCMNCHENVSRCAATEPPPRNRADAPLFAGHDAPPPHQDPLLP